MPPLPSRVRMMRSAPDAAIWAAGLVMSLPEGDRYSKHKSKLLSELAMAMGGRVAEAIVG